MKIFGAGAAIFPGAGAGRASLVGVLFFVIIASSNFLDEEVREHTFSYSHTLFIDLFVVLEYIFARNIQQEGSCPSKID